MIPFELQPFPNEDAPEIAIAGTISRQNNLLTLSYAVSGEVGAIEIPSPETPARKDELWQATCFEFFLGIQNSPQYWEFNLSPAGHWNVYAFEDYRQGMREEHAIALLPFTVSEPLKLELMLDLSAIVAVGQALEVSIATVLKTQAEEISYWALMHAGLEADFHRRESFVIEL